MASNKSLTHGPAAGDLYITATAKRKSASIRLIRGDHLDDDLAGLNKAARSWLEAIGFTGAEGTQALLPGDKGALAGVAVGAGNGTGSGNGGAPHAPIERLIGPLAKSLPAGAYHLELDDAGFEIDAELAAVAWGMGAYTFARYLSNGRSGGNEHKAAVLRMPKSVDGDAVMAAVEAVHMGRDLINTPSNDMGPQELEDAADALAKRHGERIKVTRGEDLLKNNFPLIHAVGRASTRAPRLIDVNWSGPGAKATAPAVTLIGKGICFDTGGLDIKPASSMLLMKKDMGGAAAALALAHMIMSAKLPVRLRVLVPAAENSISGDAFRPGDIITSRAGLSVEIGNTDAEGRLVLADALALADEDKPDYLMTFATLTGAARVAMGPDLPPFFLDDDEWSAQLLAAGLNVFDPLWRLPYWHGYDRMLESPYADINNVGAGGQGGAITAALFLKRFAPQTPRYAHFDVYGWRSEPGALGPKGGEVSAIRAVFRAFKDMLAA